MTEIEKCKEYLVSRGAKRIILFGSAAYAPDKARDIDIACEGIPPDKFYAVAGSLSWLLRREVDLIDLSDNTPFTKYIEKKGRVIYSVG